MSDSMPSSNDSIRVPLIWMAVSAFGLLIGIGVCGKDNGGLNRALTGAIFCTVGAVSLLISTIWLGVRLSLRESKP